MKKMIALLLVLTVVFAFAGCSKSAMTHEEYIAAELDSEVTVEFYVQATQGWWYDDEAGHGKITVYGQDKDGGYFAYEANCAEEVANQIKTGTKVRISGYKAEWEGLVEIMDGKLELVKNADTYVAEPLNATDLLGKDELIDHQSEYVSFTGLTVENIVYKNDEPGDDIYVTFGYNGASYEFCVEMYLTGPDSDVYKTVGTLNVGDVVDLEGFLYWYQGPNTHITSISLAG